MKRRLLSLLVLSMMAASIGWVHAQTIKSDMKFAQPGTPLVVSVTTSTVVVSGIKMIEPNTLVRVKLGVTKGGASVSLDGWKLRYYEPKALKWMDWTKENGEYIFGPSTGFPFMDATSYIEATAPQGSEGTYQVTLTVFSVTDQTKTITANNECIVSENPKQETGYAASPLSYVGSTAYASLPSAVRFAINNNTIQLDRGTYTLSSQLIIEKSIRIVGAPDNKTILKAIEGTWGTGGKDNLVSVEGAENPGDVLLENLVIQDAKGNGINNQSAKLLNIKNVLIKGSAKAAMVVCSKVNATGLHTEGNAWGGVNVDQGTPAYPLSFTFDATSGITESSKVWSEAKNDASVVSAPDGWRTYFAEDKRHWTNKYLTKESVAVFPTKGEYKNLTFVYANGKPVTITQSTKKAGSVTIGVNGDPTDTLEIAESAKPVVFGGSKFADIAGNTDITLKSGTVFMLFGGGYLGNVKDAKITIEGGKVGTSDGGGYLVGGGYGPKASFETAKKQTADAEKVTINITDATYIRYLVAAGMEHARTTSTQVTMAKGEVGYALGGGFAPVGDEPRETSFNDAKNRVATSTFTMTGGKVSKAVALGGGYSYAWTKSATATFSGVTFDGGLYGVGFNGNSETVKVDVKGCTFNKGTADYNTIASIVRGKVGNVAMTFDDKCTFAEDYVCYPGAGEDYAESADEPCPIVQQASYTFAGTITY